MSEISGILTGLGIDARSEMSAILLGLFYAREYGDDTIDIELYPRKKILFEALENILKVWKIKYTVGNKGIRPYIYIENIEEAQNFLDNYKIKPEDIYFHRIPECIKEDRKILDCFLLGLLELVGFERFNEDNNLISMNILIDSQVEAEFIGEYLFKNENHYETKEIKDTNHHNRVFEIKPKSIEYFTEFLDRCDKSALSKFTRPLKKNHPSLQAIYEENFCLSGDSIKDIQELKLYLKESKEVISLKADIEKGRLGSDEVWDFVNRKIIRLLSSIEKPFPHNTTLSALAVIYEDRYEDDFADYLLTTLSNSDHTELSPSIEIAKTCLKNREENGSNNEEKSI